MVESKKNKEILSRAYYQLSLTSVSPICVSSGISNITDSDVIRNGSGEVFIPGTSFAGAFRNYIGDERDEESIYGFSDSEKGRMSSAYISDLYFEPSTLTVSIRDRVSLKDDKDVDNKFDVEIIERGAKGCLRIEIISREGDLFDAEDIMNNLFIAIDDGDVRIGSLKNRGYGRFRIDAVSIDKFYKQDREAWLDYLENGPTSDSFTTFEKWKKDKTKNVEKYSIHRLPLRLKGGISIRRYSAKPDKADYEHITSNGEPIIPGTSWNGAIRSSAKQILKDIGVDGEKISRLINDWFGSEKGEDAHQSRIVISESVIKDSIAIPMTRNNINRFTSGTKDSALYSEISYFGGNTELEYMIDIRPEYDALRGMMELVTRDIENGIVALGGQVAVGRGVFTRLNSSDDTSHADKYVNALYESLIGGYSHEDK